LVLALLLKQQVRGLAFFRSSIFLPVITSLVVISTVWKLMFNSQGFINSFLQTVGLGAQPFLASPGQALLSLVFMGVWKDVGFYMLIFLAGLQAIPMELYESAEIDGATKARRFVWITLPLLRRATVFVIVIGTISAFKVFTPVYLMTDGGPADSTTVIVFYIFRSAFRYFQMGYASAMSFILLGIVLILTVVQFRLLRPSEEY
jgi:multiple sugar transport system permease protein